MEIKGILIPFLQLYVEISSSIGHRWVPSWMTVHQSNSESLLQRAIMDDIDELTTLLTELTTSRLHVLLEEISSSNVLYWPTHWASTRIQQFRISFNNSLMFFIQTNDIRTSPIKWGRREFFVVPREFFYNVTEIREMEEISSNTKHLCTCSKLQLSTPLWLKWLSYTKEIKKYAITKLRWKKQS